MHNATLIGRGIANAGFGGGVGWNCRERKRRPSGQLHFRGFNNGVLVEGTGPTSLTPAGNLLTDLHVTTDMGSSAANYIFPMPAAPTLWQILCWVELATHAHFGLDRSWSPAARLWPTYCRSRTLTPTTYRGAFRTNESVGATQWTARYD